MILVVLNDNAAPSVVARVPRRTLVGPAGAVWQIQNRTQALHPMGRALACGNASSPCSPRDRDNDYLMIDSSIVRAYAQAATGQKGRGCDQALGRSRGGLTTKWHIAVDTFGRPVRFMLTGGNASDARSAIALLTGLDATHVLADKAYDGHAILDHIEAAGAQPIIPQRTCMPRKRAFRGSG